MSAPVGGGFSDETFAKLNESKPPRRRRRQKLQTGEGGGGKKRPAEPRARIPTLSCLPSTPAAATETTVAPRSVTDRGDLMSTMYGDSAFQKRRKMISPAGRWFAVMFARNREVADSVCRTERTRIRYTSHIGSLFFAEATASVESSDEDEDEIPRRVYLTASEEPSLPETPSSGKKTKIADEPRSIGKKKSESRGQWHVVLALGPIREERDANGVCRLWSLSQKGVINKAARGEAISIRFDIPGFVDWTTVFGSAEKLCRMYDVLFYKNPCGEATVAAAKEIIKRRDDGDDRRAEKKN